MVNQQRPGRRMPSIKAIFQYWDERDFDAFPEVLGLLAEVTAFAKDEQEAKQACWGCGATDRDIDRAHLLARVYGGLDNCANLAILCRKCHEQQPDMGFETAAMWINRRAFVANNGVTFLGTLPFLENKTAEEIAAQAHEVSVLRSAEYRAHWESLTELERAQLMRDMHQIASSALGQIEEAQRIFQEKRSA